MDTNDESMAPQNAPVDAPPSTEPVEVAPKPKNKPLMYLTTIVVIALAALAILFWEGSVYGAPRQATTALTKMMAAAEKHPAYHVEGNVKLQIGASDEVAETQASAPGSMLFTDVARAQVPDALPDTSLDDAATIEINSDDLLDDEAIPGDALPMEDVNINILFEGDVVDKNTAQATIGVDLGSLAGLLGGDASGIGTSIDLNFMQVNDEIFFRVPLLSLLVGSGDNRWYGFKKSDLESLGATYSEENLNPVDYNKIQEAFKGGQRVGYETINGKLSARYHIDIDVQKALELAGTPALTEADFDFSKFNMSIDLWMGVWDHLPTRMVLDGDYDDQGTKLVVSLTADYSNYDQPATIVAPADKDVNRDGLQSLFDLGLTPGAESLEPTVTQ